jgi:hypothetical protein
MSAMGVVALRDTGRGASAKAPPPLPGPKAPPPLSSMRVPKGTVAHGEAEEGVEDWDALVARAKALAVEEDADDWNGVIASARARAAEEESAWAEAAARAKRMAALEPARSLVGKQPQRPPRRAIKMALVPPASPAAQPRSAPALVVDEEAEWQQMRAQAGLRMQDPPRVPQVRAITHDVFSPIALVPAPAKPAPRVVAWP